MVSKRILSMLHKKQETLRHSPQTLASDQKESHVIEAPINEAIYVEALTPTEFCYLEYAFYAEEPATEACCFEDQKSPPLSRLAISQFDLQTENLNRKSRTETSLIRFSVCRSN
jgi:hypothetical protein